MVPMKSAHSSAVHSAMMVSGSLSALARWAYVVGVCSADVDSSESMGEASESPTGERSPMLRSYSSSASDSA